MSTGVESENEEEGYVFVLVRNAEEWASLEPEAVGALRKSAGTPTAEALEAMIKMNDKMEGQLQALRCAASLDDASPIVSASSRSPKKPRQAADDAQVDTLSGLMGSKQRTNIVSGHLVNKKAAEEYFGEFTFHPKTSYTERLLAHGKQAHEASFHRRRAEGVVRQVLEMRSGHMVTDAMVDEAAQKVLTLTEDRPRLRAIGRLRGQKKLMMAVNAMQCRDFTLRNAEQLNQGSPTKSPRSPRRRTRSPCRARYKVHGRR